MNVNLSWAAEILCITVVDERIVANNYSLGIDFITNSTDSRKQNIAFERMKFMLAKIFNQSVFISGTNKLLPKVIDLLPANLVILPEEAYDQIVNLAIYCKLNSIMEGALLIDSMSISSSVNDDITYSFSNGDSLGPFTINVRKKVKPWWARPDLRTSDNPEGYFPIDAWGEIGLEFETVVPKKTTSKNKKKLDIKEKTSYTKPNTKTKGFHPEIIIGGKNNDAD
jgi:hypothetical protein